MQVQELIEPELQKYEKDQKNIFVHEYFVGTLQSMSKFVFITRDLDHISEEFNFALLSSILDANIRVS